MNKEEKKVWHLCITCDKEFVEYDSRHRKFCSRECYYKSLTEHGKTLFFNYGRKALLAYRNLKDTAYNLGFRIKDWRETTKRELEEFINKILRTLEKKLEMVRMYNMRLEDLEINGDYIPPPNLIPID